MLTDIDRWSVLRYVSLIGTSVLFINDLIHMELIPSYDREIIFKRSIIKWRRKSAFSNKWTLPYRSKGLHP